MAFSLCPPSNTINGLLHRVSNLALCTTVLNPLYIASSEISYPLFFNISIHSKTSAAFII